MGSDHPLFTRATVELFAKEGAKVIIVGTKEELGESCVNEIKSAGGEAIFCKTDVTSDESLDNLVKTALDAYGKIDILVNNAGVGGTTADMDQITMDEWNTVLATNLTAPFILCKKIIPIMEKQGAGTIVNVASMAATAAGRGGLAYTSAKHGDRKEHTSELQSPYVISYAVFCLKKQLST